MDNNLRAQVLTEALPYIQKYAGRVILIKYGGNAMTDESLKRDVMRDIVLLTMIGIKVVLVHGGGPEISDMLKKVGKKSEFVDGLRVTDGETMDIVEMVLAGKVNKDLVSYCQSAGGKAVGLSGIDGRTILAEAMDPRLGSVGQVKRINTQLITDMMDMGYIPIISTIGCDEEGRVYNINADTAAARIAGALGAESMLTMTDISGLLRDRNDPSSLISKLSVSEVPELRACGAISDGMIPKVQCCVEAIRRGVKRVFIIDGRVRHSILMELLSDAGLGTMFTA